MTNGANNHRPRGWLVWLTALLALANAGAAIRVLSVPPELAALVSLPMPLEVGGGAAWAAAFALVTAALARRHPRGLRLAAWTLVGFALYNAARWLLFARADYDRERLPLLLAATLLLTLIPTAYLASRALKASRTTETIRDEHQSPN